MYLANSLFGQPVATLYYYIVLYTTIGAIRLYLVILTPINRHYLLDFRVNIHVRKYTNHGCKQAWWLCCIVMCQRAMCNMWWSQDLVHRHIVQSPRLPDWSLAVSELWLMSTHQGSHCSTQACTFTVSSWTLAFMFFSWYWNTTSTTSKLLCRFWMSLSHHMWEDLFHRQLQYIYH